VVPSTRCRSIDDRATGDGESCRRDADQKKHNDKRNNTRKKANAVFFAAIMVVSMVAVGFAAAPAAAYPKTIDDGDVDDLDKGTANSHRALRSRLKMAQTIMDPHPERQK